MTLIAILVAMLTEGTWKSFGFLGQFDAVLRVGGWMQKRVGDASWFNSGPGVLAVIAPGVVLVGMIQSVLTGAEGLLAALLSLVFFIAVLVFCIGIRGLNIAVEGYLDALARGDVEGAYLKVRDILGESAPQDPVQLNRMLLENMLVRNNERLLAILFWFVVLGPMGAVIYRSTCQLKGMRRLNPETETDFIEAAVRLQAILDWLPVRITAFCYAVIGSFVDAMRNWGMNSVDWGGDWALENRGIIIASGIGALQLHGVSHEAGTEVDLDELRHQIMDAQEMVKRTVVAWITFFALLTIVGWLV